MFGKSKSTATAGLRGLTVFKGVIPTVASLAFIIYISYLGWMSLGPEKPVPDEKRQNIAAQGVTNVLEQIRSGRGQINTAVLLHFANDPTDFVSDSLRLSLNNSGVLSLEDRPFMEKLRNKLNLINSGCATRTGALKCAREAGVDGVLWGVIERFESFPDGALIKGRWELLDAKSGAVKCSGVIDEDSTRKEPVTPGAGNAQAGKDPAGELAGSLPVSLRIAGYLLCMLMLPLVSFAFIRCQVARDSNRINALLLGLLTLIDLILAYFMVSGAFATPSGVFLFLGGGAAAFLYNTGMMRFARKLES